MFTAKGQRTVIIGMLALIAYLLWSNQERVVVVSSEETGATDTKPSAPASDKTIQLKPAI